MMPSRTAIPMPEVPRLPPKPRTHSMLLVSAGVVPVAAIRRGMHRKAAFRYMTQAQG